MTAFRSLRRISLLVGVKPETRMPESRNQPACRASRTCFGLRPSNFGLRPSNLGLRPSAFGLRIPVWALLLLALTGCKQGDADKPTPPPVAVTAQVVTNRVFVRLLTVTGTVEPTTVAGLASQAEGPVLGCRVREGDHVTEGQGLLRIGRQLSAEAAQASAREEFRRQEQEFQRITALVADKAVPGDQLDTARAALERARAALAQAEQAAGDYSIRAPWAGVVSRVRVADGNYVAPRTPLVDLYDPASVVLRFAVPEDHAFALAAGGRVQVTFDALPGRAFTLEIIRAYPELDRRLRTRAFEAALPAEATFAPGMFARIRAVLEEQASALTVPVEAVFGDGVRSFVFVLAEDKAARRAVEPGFEQDGRVWIRTGLEAGDRVIVGGLERVKDGAPVRLEGSPAKGATDKQPTANAL
jgi:membrane fusion protein (multidrug efflux system)